MTSAHSPDPRPAEDDLELLLPFYAIGALAAGQARQVEARLADDAEFRRRLDLIEEERDQTVRVNAAIAPPSSAARDRLFAMIDAEPARAAAQGARAMAGAPMRVGLRRWFGELAGALTPRAMGYAVAGLAVVVVAQAGVLAHLASAGREATAPYVMASAPAGQEHGQHGVHALVRFAPGASVADVGEWLQANGMQIVEGPKPGGLWRLQIADDRAAADAAFGKLRQNSALFSTVVPE